VAARMWGQAAVVEVWEVADKVPTASFFNKNFFPFTRQIRLGRDKAQPAKEVSGAHRRHTQREHGEESQCPKDCIICLRHPVQVKVVTAEADRHHMDLKLCSPHQHPHS
jgi:hypothetical protein